MKNPDAAAFVRDVMRRVGADNPTELSKILGPPWTERDQQRKLYKWHDGTQGPKLSGALALLRAAGMLREPEAERLPVQAPRDSVADRLAALEATVDERGQDTTTALKALTAGIRRLERRLDAGDPPASRTGRS